jgi:hypothetical protein
MATQLKKTVKPTGQGGDYTSLDAAETAQEQNLVTADKYLLLEIDGDWSGAADSFCSVQNYTTSETCYIRIYTTSAARHSGKWDDTKYRIVYVDTTNPLRISVPFVRVEGLQVYGTGTGSGKDIIYVNDTTANAKQYVSNCIVRVDTNNTGNPFGVNFEVASTATCWCWNCIAQDFVNAQGFYSALCTSYFYNCTAYNASSASGVGYHSASGTTLWKNCGAAACQTGFSGGTQTTCSTSTPTFVSTAGTYDLHLQSGDTTWKDQGTDLSADANRPFGDTTITLDIDGQTRSGSWDIGADEYVASGPTVLSYTPSESYLPTEGMSPIMSMKASIGEQV